MPGTKIFIDTDEEITFIAEKIKLANTKNVVVIVPDRASIFVTSTSLKLLKKYIDKLDKKVILITMDDAGKKIAAGLDIVCKNRVSDITPYIWNDLNLFPPVKSKSSHFSEMSKKAKSNENDLTFKKNESISNEVIEEKNDNTHFAQASSEDENVVPNLQKFSFKGQDEPEIISQEIAEDKLLTEDNKADSVKFLHTDEDEIDAVDVNNLDISTTVINKDEDFKLPHFEANQSEIDEIISPDIEEMSKKISSLPSFKKAFVEPILNNSLEIEDDMPNSTNEQENIGFIFMSGSDVAESQKKK